MAALVIAGLAVLPATAAAVTQANVSGCVNSGGTQIPGSSVGYTGVNGSGEEIGPFYSFPAANGCYSGQVNAGHYLISFSAPHYVYQWYSNVTKKAEASPVTLSEGQSYSYSASMVHLPSVTGKVVDATTGKPLEGWLVQFTGPNLEGSGITGFDTYTNSEGVYEIDFETSGALGPGTWYACTGNTVNNNLYMPDCYGGAKTAAASTPIGVTAGNVTTNVNFSVPEAGYVTGRVFGPLGEPDNFNYLTITAYDAAGHVLAVDENGAGSGGGYSLIVPVGTAYIGFHQPPYADQFYSAKGGLSCADPVSVAFNETTLNIDAHMSNAPPAPCPGGAPGGGGGTGGGGAPSGGGGTGGGAPPPGGAAGGTPGLPGHQTVALAGNGAGAVNVSCSSAGPCSGSVTLTVGGSTGKALAAPAGARAAVIAHTKFAGLARGKVSPVRFKLNPTGLKLLKRGHGSLRANVAITSTAAGRTTSSTGQIKLRTSAR
ncbi:MAG: hypothetical protein JSU06_16335 [Actinobacteria bacterium]|nr:hypothetical protein [Actinomycetota bacterium]